jgi:hypothetical protein
MGTISWIEERSGIRSGHSTAMQSALEVHKRNVELPLVSNSIEMSVQVQALGTYCSVNSIPGTWADDDEVSWILIDNMHLHLVAWAWHTQKAD